MKKILLSLYNCPKQLSDKLQISEDNHMARNLDLTGEKPMLIWPFKNRQIMHRDMKNTGLKSILIIGVWAQ